MKKKSFMDLYFSSKPLFKKVVDVGEWVIIILIGWFFPSPWLTFPPFNYILGAILLATGFFIHKLSHNVNPQAHWPKEKITQLVTSGIYSKVRHPGYSGYIWAYFGIFFILGSLWSLIPIFIFSYLFYDSAIKEEKFLLKKFEKEYEKYMRNVPWRFIPYFF